MNHHQVFVVRHGATEWSVSGRHTGSTDIALTDEGREQARRVGELLAGHRFSLVLVSPLGRARETCEIAGYADQAEVTDDLREWDYGSYEGRTTAEIREHDPGWTVWTGAIPGGESIDDVAARAQRVVNRVLEVDGDDVALFAHGHILRVVVATWCELPPVEGRRFLLETGSLNVLGWEHQYRGVRVFNQR